MNVGAAILAVIYLALAGWGLYWGVIWLRCRISPKYAAQRKLRAKAKSDREWENRQQRRAAKEDRLKVWATAHSDDPVAKALLADGDKASAITPAPVTGSDSDFLATLRRRQEEADALTARIEARRAAEALLEQQLLDWAIEHPSESEARRHLVEVMVASSQQIEQAERDARLWGFFTEGSDSAEAIESGSKIAEAEARKAAAERTIARIQTALTGSQQ